MSKFESELANKINALPKEKRPERDLWKGIELGLETESKNNSSASKMPMQWPALAACVIAVAVLVIYTLGGGGKGNPAVIDGEMLVQALSKQHEEQKQVLLTRFDGQAALTEDWQQQLTELDEAANAIKLALEQDPDNTALLGMLQHVYQQQLLLIERVHAPKWQQI